MQTGQNDIVIFLLVTTGIILLLAVLIITLLYLYKKKQTAHQEKLELLQLDHERNMLATRLEIQEDTFSHISREIHDNINLSLTLAKLHLNTINLQEKEPAAEKVAASVELLSHSIDDLSRLSRSLNADIIQSQGLLTALDNEIARIRATGLFRLDYSIEGTPVYMDTQKELVIFRIIQEAFNNILKHARASVVALGLYYKPEELLIRVKDNGEGFIHNNLNGDNDPGKRGKAGLKNMAGRTRAISGNMSVLSAPGQGTELSFTIPY